MGPIAGLFGVGKIAVGGASIIAATVKVHNELMDKYGPTPPKYKIGDKIIDGDGVIRFVTSYSGHQIETIVKKNLFDNPLYTTQRFHEAVSYGWLNSDRKAAPGSIKAGGVAVIATIPGWNPAFGMSRFENGHAPVLPESFKNGSAKIVHIESVTDKNLPGVVCAIERCVSDLFNNRGK